MLASFVVILSRLLYEGEAKAFKPLGNLVYQVPGVEEYQWWEVPIFLAIGFFNGALGALFIIINEKINRARLQIYGPSTGGNALTRFIKKHPKPCKILEAVLCSVFTVSHGFAIALAVPCMQIPEHEAAEGINKRFVQFTCPDGQYNEMASLMVFFPDFISKLS